MPTPTRIRQARYRERLQQKGGTRFEVRVPRTIVDYIRSYPGRNDGERLVNALGVTFRGNEHDVED